jgi:hypothetical protein
MAWSSTMTTLGRGGWDMDVDAGVELGMGYGKVDVPKDWFS